MKYISPAVLSAFASLLFFSGFNYSLAAAVPGGNLDTASCSILAGWAYDPDLPGEEVGIHIYKDGPAGSGTFVTDVATTGLRTDVNAAFGISGTHGFTIATPTSLKDGASHSLYIYAVDQSGASAQLSGSPKIIQCASSYATPYTYQTPATYSYQTPAVYSYQSPSVYPYQTPASQKTPVGNLDIASCSILAGWAYDPDSTSAAVDIKIYKDGSSSAGTLLVSTPTAGLRTDVNAAFGISGNHGFTISMPDSIKDGVSHKIYVYAVDSSGQSAQVSGSPATVKCSKNGYPTPAYLTPSYPTPNYPTPATSVDGDAEISKRFGSSLIKIRTSSKFAGAIESLTWKGKEFINSFDHGRELQTAVFIDNWGECYNPTEAGGSYDRTSSTSVLKEFHAFGNRLKSKTQMAYWWPAHADYGRLCSPTKSSTVRTSQNTTNLSDYFLEKEVTIGVSEVADNIIVYEANFISPRHHAVWGLSIVGYSPADFSKLFTFDPNSDTLAPYTKKESEGPQSVPVIVATEDENYAIGAYSPHDIDGIAPLFGAVRYGSRSDNQEDTTVWNCMFIRGATFGGTYQHKCYVIVGTLQDVKSSMKLLDNHIFHPTEAPVVESFSGTARVSQIGQELSWKVFNADTVTIEPEIGEVNSRGTQYISPARPTTYTLTATNAYGTTKKAVKVVPEGKFTVGDRVGTVGTASVYNEPPSGFWIPAAGSQPSSSRGVIKEGPREIIISDFRGVRKVLWWRVDFASGTDGWVSEESLESREISFLNSIFSRVAGSLKLIPSQNIANPLQSLFGQQKISD